MKASLQKITWPLFRRINLKILLVSLGCIAVGALGGNLMLWYDLLFEAGFWIFYIMVFAGFYGALISSLLLIGGLIKQLLKRGK